jgi:hypothetical protein
VVVGLALGILIAKICIHTILDAARWATQIAVRVEVVVVDISVPGL